MNLDQIIARRRSNRKYAPDQEVPEEIILKSLERAILSPNSSNMQLWEFYYTADPEKIEEITPICLNQSAAKTAKYLVFFITRQDLWKQRAEANYQFVKNSIENQNSKRGKQALSYYAKLMPLVYRQDPLGIWTLIRKAICGFSGISKPFYRMGGKADQRVMVHKSIALAAQTFMLSIAEQDFDTCPMEGFDRKRLKKYLKLPADAEISMIISVGKGLEEGIYGERFRIDNQEVIKKF